MKQREIKFRAWGKDWDGVFRMSFSDRYEEDEVPTSAHMLMSYFFRNLNPDAKLMQSTGLKDKNGKEIYEGDIITQDRLTGKVIYSRYRFFLEWNQNHKARVTLGSPHPNEENNFSTKCEVIGNIYENANLLQSKDKV